MSKPPNQLSSAHSPATACSAQQKSRAAADRSAQARLVALTRPVALSRQHCDACAGSPSDERLVAPYFRHVTAAGSDLKARVKAEARVRWRETYAKRAEEDIAAKLASMPALATDAKRGARRASRSLFGSLQVEFGSIGPAGWIRNLTVCRLRRCTRLSVPTRAHPSNAKERGKEKRHRGQRERE